MSVWIRRARHTFTGLHSGDRLELRESVAISQLFETLAGAPYEAVEVRCRTHGAVGLGCDAANQEELDLGFLRSAASWVSFRWK
jgi:hypothetical protein